MNMFGLEPLMPAYGRDYTDIVDVQKDFDNNKDFKAASGQYTNKSDLVKMGLKGKIRVRFNKILETDFVEVR